MKARKKQKCEFCKKHPAVELVYRTVPDPRGYEMGGWMTETAYVCRKCYNKVVKDNANAIWID
jgi:hypothetical protein